MANSFSKMIKAGVIKRTDNGMYIRLADIHIRPGFNERDIDEEYEQSIVELEAFLEAGGEVDAMRVTARDDGGVWVDDGHRRTAAYTRLNAKGAPVEWIHIRQFNGNDAERVALIATSNSQKPLKPLERARVYARLRAFNWSNDDIAKRMGKDTKHVRDHLALIDSPTVAQDMVKAGQVSATVAVNLVRQHGEKAVEVLGRELESAKAQGKSKITETTIRQAKPKDKLSIPVELLKSIRRDFDACQKVIHYAGGFDPAYVNDALARIKEIDELLAKAGVE